MPKLRISVQQRKRYFTKSKTNKRLISTKRKLNPLWRKVMLTRASTIIHMQCLELNQNYQKCKETGRNYQNPKEKRQYQ